MGNMRPFPDLLAEIHEKTLSMGNVQRGGLLKAIAGEEAGSAMNVLVEAAGGGGLQSFIAELRAAHGEAASTSKTMGDNLAGDLDELSSAWSDIKITLFEVTKGPLRELTQRLTEVVNKVGAWAQRNPELVATLAKMAGVVGVLSAAFGGIAMSVAAVLGPFALARFALTGLTIRGAGLVTTLVGLAKTAIPAVGAAMAAVGKVLLANPIVMVAAAIAAAAVAIYANWDTLGPMFQRLWDTISERTSQAWAAVTGFFGSAWDEIKAGFSGGIAGIGATILNWSPIGLFYQVFAEVLSYLGVDLPNRFTEFGSMIMQGLINGIKGMVGGVKDAVVGVADSTVGWFKEKLGIQSPSRVFMGMGENVSEGAAIGIERGRALAAKAAGGLAALMTAAGMAGQPALSMPALTFDTRAPLGAMQGFGAAMGSMGAAAGGGVTVQGDTINITIQVGPDQQPQDIARAISAELDRRERQKAARTRSSLSDYGL
ncbi:MAG: phage tail tape measure protein, partial [Alcaligenaceae bacterium]|nr:phage tail tape measure protein [Alcaligenaceae bacterium]